MRGLNSQLKLKGRMVFLNQRGREEKVSTEGVEENSIPVIPGREKKGVTKGQQVGVKTRGGSQCYALSYQGGLSC